MWATAVLTWNDPICAQGAHVFSYVHVSDKDVCVKQKDFPFIMTVLERKLQFKIVKMYADWTCVMALVLLCFCMGF